MTFKGYRVVSLFVYDISKIIVCKSVAKIRRALYSVIPGVFLERMHAFKVYG